ncbi:hypothetical protein J6A31_04785 [bacterium]|nr:hypothetical protein [bacterium]
MSNQVNVNELAEAAIVKFIATIFGDIAVLDPDTVRHNVELACKGGMSEADRSIRAELAVYLLKNFAYIYMGLIANAEFRDTFKEAVSVEIALDSKSEAFVKQIRGDMKFGKAGTSKGNFVIDLSSYSNSVHKKFNNQAAESLNKIASYGDAIGEMMQEMTNEDKVVNGFCISNFMYVIRAFAKNELFANYVKTVVHGVQNELGI